MWKWPYRGMVFVRHPKRLHCHLTQLNTNVISITIPYSPNLLRRFNWARMEKLFKKILFWFLYSDLEHDLVTLWYSISPIFLGCLNLYKLGSLQPPNSTTKLSYGFCSTYNSISWGIRSNQRCLIKFLKRRSKSSPIWSRIRSIMLLQGRQTRMFQFFRGTNALPKCLHIACKVRLCQMLLRSAINPLFGFIIFSCVYGWWTCYALSQLFQTPGCEYLFGPPSFGEPPGQSPTPTQFFCCLFVSLEWAEERRKHMQKASRSKM